MKSEGNLVVKGINNRVRAFARSLPLSHALISQFEKLQVNSGTLKLGTWGIGSYDEMPICGFVGTKFLQVASLMTDRQVIKGRLLSISPGGTATVWTAAGVRRRLQLPAEFRIGALVGDQIEAEIRNNLIVSAKYSPLPYPFHQQSAVELVEESDLDLMSEVVIKQYGTFGRSAALKKKIPTVGPGTSMVERVVKARKGLDQRRFYPLAEAVKMVKARATAKFDETIEVAMNLGVDPRHADQVVRGVCNLPNGTGRKVRVAVFARGTKADEARAAGADLVGAEDLAEIINSGKIEFDRCIATPDMMGIVGRLGKVLGPRGLMPNPRVGTVTIDVAGAVKGFKGGAVEFRVEKAGIVHAGVGKASFDESKLIENIKAFVDSVNKAKPTGAKGTYLQRVAISSSMGPGVNIDLDFISSPSK